MKNSSTTEDLRRLSFVESLYKQLRQQARQEGQTAMEDHDRLVAKASIYMEDGLTTSECEELLVIDGITRASAESYVQLAQSNKPEIDGRYEYSFQFEDVYGKVWSSYDINHTIYASSNEEAWEKAETTVFANSSIEPERIVSVDRIS